jgi:hypothetical protein
VINSQVEPGAGHPAILTAMTIAHQYSSSLCARATLATANVDVFDQANHAWHGKDEMLRSEHTSAVKLDHFRRTFPYQSHGSRGVDGAESFIRRVQQQNLSG